MRVDPEVAALVLCAAILHASWNAIVKSDSDRLLALGIVMLAGALIGLVATPFLPLPDPAAWPYLAGSTGVHVFYYWLVLGAYRYGELSHVYPIARGLGPLLVAVFSGRIAGEHLSLVEALGVALVSGGIASLAFGHGFPRGGREWHPVIYAALTGCTIAAYTFIDGIGARRSGHAISYIAWLNVLEGPWVFAVALTMRRGRVLPYLRRFWARGLVGGVIATVGYGIAIWALSLGAMAHVAALRETSVIFAALIGTLLLGETFGKRRIAAAALVATGLLAMNLPFGR